MKARIGLLLAVLGSAAVSIEPSRVVAGVYVNPADEFIVSAIPDHLQYSARLWESIVVWTAGIKGDIWAKDMAADEVFFVGAGGGIYANIHNGTIVWSPYTGGVWAFDVDTRSSALVAGGGPVTQPDVYGPLVVWRGNDGRIHIKNIETGWTDILPDGGSYPHIYGDNVVWNVGHVKRGYRLSSGVSFQVSALGGSLHDLQGYHFTQAQQPIRVGAGVGQ